MSMPLPVFAFVFEISHVAFTCGVATKVPETPLRDTLSITLAANRSELPVLF